MFSDKGYKIFSRYGSIDCIGIWSLPLTTLGKKILKKPQTFVLIYSHGKFALEYQGQIYLLFKKIAPFTSPNYTNMIK